MFFRDIKRSDVSAAVNTVKDKLMVLSTGMLVKRLSTLREAIIKFSTGGALERISRKSVGELSQ